MEKKVNSFMSFRKKKKTVNICKGLRKGGDKKREMKKEIGEETKTNNVVI